jgi:N-acetylglucosaminyldiphosphoundecaprenol N-acetyl-beta-D-mannosaminyltransferase
METREMLSDHAITELQLPRMAAVLCLPVAITDYKSAVTLLLAWAEAGAKPRLVAAANTHLVTTARRDSDFNAAIQRFDLIVPDGMPLVWYLNLFENAALADRVYGPTLMLRCLEAAPGPFRHFFLGGSLELRQKLEHEVQSRFPHLQIVEGYSPPFGAWSESEDDRILNAIAAGKPHFVWVGLGCPKQELFLSRLRDRLAPAVYLAVGAAFPLISGAVRQAPPRLQKLGLEWAFRLAMEPRRLWKRYLVNNAFFLWFSALEAGRRFSHSFGVRGS